MLRAVIIAPDTEMTASLVNLAGTSGLVDIVRTVDKYITGQDLDRCLRAHAPDIVFLYTNSAPEALHVIHEIEQLAPGTAVTALDRRTDPGVLVELMRAGVREFLSFPFQETDFVAMIIRLQGVAAKRTDRPEAQGTLFAFLPAKAGVGASTIVLNTALALSRMPDSSTLMMDLDLNSGIIGFMLKLENAYTIYEAVESAGKLDEHLWPQLITSFGGLDVLPAGRLDLNTRIATDDLRLLLGFARRFYHTICVDLSGNLERFSIDLMHEARKVFLVTTPEVPALHLARQKLQVLRQLELADRTAVLLNRSQRKMVISREQIEQLLGMEVFLDFPNDYRGVHRAMTEATEVESKTDLGRQFAQLAMQLSGREPEHKPEAPRKRFIEFFSVGNRAPISEKA